MNWNVIQVDLNRFMMTFFKPIYFIQTSARKRVSKHQKKRGVVRPIQNSAYLHQLPLVSSLNKKPIQTNDIHQPKKISLDSKQM